MLATTYDGVVWGKWGANVWVLSNQATTLPADALLDLRAFGPEDEILSGVMRKGCGRATATTTAVMNATRSSKSSYCGALGVESNSDAPAGFTTLVDGDQVWPTRRRWCWTIAILTVTAIARRGCGCGIISRATRSLASHALRIRG
ncbi:MAG: hypothetical protein R3C44_18600 [Chloroflexota bacterium]